VEEAGVPLTPLRTGRYSRRPRRGGGRKRRRRRRRLER